MTYVTFILTIGNIINTRIYGDNVYPTPKDILETNDYVNNKINEFVSYGKILEITKPKLNVCFDRISHTYVCVPANILTMHMSLTIKYDMANITYYNHFKHLIDTEPDFISDITKRHKSEIRKYELRSQDKFPGIVYYKDVFGFPNYNSLYDFDILETLKHEFILNMRHCNTFQDFKDIVVSSIHRIDELYVMTNGMFKAHIMWTNMFSDIIYRNGQSRYAECQTNSFRNLYNIYSPEQINLRINAYSEAHKYVPKPPHKTTNRNPMMVFMGLQIGFSENQLKKRYRKLAVQYHPDKSGGDADKFLYLKECYETLLATI